MVNVIGKLIQYVTENPKKVALATVAITALLKNLGRFTNGAGRIISAKQEQYNKERYVYDHSLGIYLKTKRKLTSEDLRMIDRLRTKGFTKVQALMKLGLLED